jgi:predicted O-methyltransferase YrrM
MVDSLSGGIGRQVDTYIQNLFNPSDPVLENALAELENAGLPPINVSPNEGKLLYLLASISGARTMVEIGTLAGYSTIWLARALPLEGKLITLEIDPKHAAVARHNFEAAGLSAKIELRLGSALESLKAMQEAGEGPFDLFFIDADKGGYEAYLDLALKLSHPGTLILADNVVRNGEVVHSNPANSASQAIQRFNYKLANIPNLESIILPIIRDKLDGISISIVR